MAGRKKTDRPKVTCRVCGAQLKQITHKHLQRHGMTLEEYRRKYENVQPPALTEHQVSRGEIFDNLADWLSQDSQLTPIAHRMVESLLMDDGKRFGVVLRAVAAAKMQRLKDMLMAMDRVENELYDPLRIANASTAELLTLKKLLDSDMSGLTDLLLQLTGQKNAGPAGVHLNLNAVVDQRTQIISGGEEFPVPSTPQQRERLLRTFQQLKSLVAQGGIPEPVPVNGG